MTKVLEVHVMLEVLVMLVIEVLVMLDDQGS